MSVKKYRLYLLMLALIAVIVGALAYLYFEEQDKAYKDGTLVQNEVVLENETLAQNEVVLENETLAKNEYLIEEEAA